MRDRKGANSAKALLRLTERESACQNLGANDENLCIRWMGHMRQAWGPCWGEPLPVMAVGCSNVCQRGALRPCAENARPCIGGSVVGTAQPLPQGGFHLCRRLSPLTTSPSPRSWPDRVPRDRYHRNFLSGMTHIYWPHAAHCRTRSGGTSCVLSRHHRCIPVIKARSASSRV